MRKTAAFLIIIFILTSCAPVQTAVPAPVTQPPPASTFTPSPLPTLIPTSTVLPSATASPTPGPTPLPKPFPASIIKTASLFAGPGNLDYPSLALLPPGAQVTVLGSYGDFVMVEANLKGKTKPGFIWKNAFAAFPSEPAALPASQMPWQTLMDLKCFTAGSLRPGSKITFQNPTGKTQEISSYAFGMDKPLRLTVRFTRENQMLWLIDSSEDGDKTKQRSLDVLVRNGVYQVRIRQAGGYGWAVSYNGPASSQSSLMLQFNDPHGKTFTIFDGSRQPLLTVDVTGLKSVHLPNGLFPEGSVTAGFQVAARSALSLDEYLLEKLPSGGWIKTIPDTGPGLAQLARQKGITIGTEFALERIIDPRYCSIMRKNFNLAVVSEFSYPDMWRGPGDYDFSDSDQEVDYANNQGWRVRGFHLVWGAKEMGVLPDWLVKGGFSRDELIAILEQHVRTVVGHFKGRVKEWSIANEAVNRMLPKGAPDFWMDEIGPEYIEMAFRWARETDPDALLIFNNYQNESPRDEDTTLTVDTLYQMVKDLKDRGVPIDVVGMEYHLLLPWGSPIPPTRQGMVDTMRRFGDLGVKLQITELDVNLHDIPGLQRDKWKFQASLYQDITAACIESGVCTSITTWGVSDGDSWITCVSPLCQQILDADPLMFDEAFNPKPAYFAVRDELMKGLKPTPTPKAAPVP